MKEQDLIRKAITDYLEGLPFPDQVHYWNRYAAETGEDYIYSTLEDASEGMSKDEALRALFFGEVDSWYDRVRLNSYCNFESVHELPSLYGLVDWIIDWGKYSVIFTAQYGELYGSSDTVDGALENLRGQVEEAHQQDAVEQIMASAKVYVEEVTALF